MKKEPRRLIALATSLFIILFIPLIYESFSHSLDSWDGKSIWRDGFSTEEQRMKLNLRRLKCLTGEDKAQLQATGFSCSSDVYSDVCVANKGARIIDNATLAVHVLSNREPRIKQILIRPYPRKVDPPAMNLVSPVKILEGSISSSPLCRYNHNVPAVIFSSGGFVGNTFHEINEIIIPLFITTWHFKSQVQFVITDYNPELVSKYGPILRSLSHYEPIGAAGNGTVHCFPAVIIGLMLHEYLTVNSTQIPGGYSMPDFKKFLCDTYNLKVKGPLVKPEKPVLILIARRTTRVFLNEDELVKMMEEIGFEVRIALPDEMSNLEKFSQVVNSGHVMVGAHGAGLVNQVFLPSGAVVVQVVPLELDWPSDNYFGKPAYGMGLKYVKYKIEANESSLYEEYGPDDPVITNPASIHAKGYMAVRSVYIEGQNFRINLVRFRKTLVQALKLLGS
ncbi:hypothetical protein Ancab_004465 [Ancistrocladus abbreviatus]